MCIRIFDDSKNSVTSHAVTLSLHLCLNGVERVPDHRVGRSEQHSAHCSENQLFLPMRPLFVVCHLIE